MISALAGLIFYGGSPDAYARFMGGTFATQFIIQVDHTPVIPRLNGERHINSLASFVPQFYFGYSKEGPISVLSGKFFNPVLTGCQNPDDKFVWARDLLAKQYTKGLDHGYSVGEAVSATGFFEVGQLLNILYPGNSLKPGCFSRTKVYVNVKDCKKALFLQALGKCLDSQIVPKEADVVLRPQADRIRARVLRTYEEYSVEGQGFIGQLFAFDHDICASLPDSSIADLYLGKKVTYKLTSSSLVSRLKSILELEKKQNPSSQLLESFNSRDMDTSIELTFGSFARASHLFAVVHGTDRMAVTF